MPAAAVQFTGGFWSVTLHDMRLAVNIPPLPFAVTVLELLGCVFHGFERTCVGGTLLPTLNDLPRSLRKLKLYKEVSCM